MRGFIVLLAALGAGTGLHAQERPYFVTYDQHMEEPGTLEVALTGWVPTLELTVYVRALPAPGPVRILQQARMIDAGRVDEACFVWDSTGRLVAQGTQLAGIRLPG